jgi:hypothetical protein
VRSETVKLIQEKIGNTLDHRGIGNNFMNGTSISQQLQESIHKWDCMKLKSFCTEKETLTRLKGQLTKSLQVIHLTWDYTESSKNLPPQRINNPLTKWTYELNRQFSEVHMANKYMKKCPTSLSINEVQMKTTLRFHFTPVKMATSITQTTTNAGKDAGQKEHFYTLGVIAMESNMEIPQKTKNRTIIQCRDTTPRYYVQRNVRTYY